MAPSQVWTRRNSVNRGPTDPLIFRLRQLVGFSNTVVFHQYGRFFGHNDSIIDYLNIVIVFFNSINTI